MVRRGNSLGRAMAPCALLFGLLSLGCDDSPLSSMSSPSSSSPSTTTTTAPASSGSAFLRAAQLARDPRSVDVVVNGQDLALAVPFPGVSSYFELAPGEYRVQFFPARSRHTATIETIVTLSANEWVTIAVVGLSSLETVRFEDPPAPDAGRALVSMVNAVPDFPAPFDTAVLNGPLLFADVGYLQTSAGAERLIPGIYDLELRRAGSSETLATSSGNAFNSGARYTLFAVGTLRRDDIAILVASDSR